MPLAVVWVNWLTFSPSSSPHHQVFVSLGYRKCCGGIGPLLWCDLVFFHNIIEDDYDTEELPCAGEATTHKYNQTSSIYRLQHLGLIFYPHPLRERGSTDGNFLLFLYLHTSNFLFLLGTENAVGGHGSLAVYVILFDILIITLFDWLTFCSHIINTNHLNFLSMVLVMTAVLSLSKSQCLQEVLNLNYSLRNGIVWWFSGLGPELEFKDLVRLFWECYISSTYGCTHEHTLTINCYKSWHTNITAITLPYPTINIELISLLFCVF